MVFNNKFMDFQQLCDAIKFRIAMWYKAKWPDGVDSFMDVVRFSNAIKTPVIVKPVRAITSWKHPSANAMKFNVDGSSKRKPGPIGIGGVLKDSSAVVKIVFSKPIGMANSNVAELLAVREAMCIFVSSKWINSHRLIIESDSSNVVRWILNPNSIPWKLKIFNSHIEALKLQLGS